MTGTGGSPAGYAAASDGWQITHQVGTTTIADASGTAPAASQFVFAAGTLYTVTVTGNGSVFAGSPQ